MDKKPFYQSRYSIIVIDKAITNQQRYTFALRGKIVTMAASWMVRVVRIGPTLLAERMSKRTHLLTSLIHEGAFAGYPAPAVPLAA